MSFNTSASLKKAKKLLVCRRFIIFVTLLMDLCFAGNYPPVGVSNTHLLLFGHGLHGLTRLFVRVYINFSVKSV